MNNRKIIYEPEKISSEEIKQRRDFDIVVSSLKKPPSPFWKLTSFWGTVGTSVIALLIYNNYFLKTEENKNPAYDDNITQTIKSQANNLPEDTKCLQPINEENDIPFETFEIEANESQILTLNNGSVITIPSNAFSTNSSDRIEIKARTFESKSEAFIAGVPMDYEDKAFESAGMIELRGFQNGEVVEINPENPIEVNLSLYKDPSDFNFYQLDETSAKWKEYPADYSEINNREVVKSEISNLKNQIEQVDSKIEELDIEIASVEFPNRQDFQLPLENSKMFNLKYDPFEFPALEELGDVEFEALAGQKNYKKVIHHVWSDFELNELQNGKYKVIFSNRKGQKESLNVRPVVQGRQFDEAVSKYNTLRDAKIKEVDQLEKEKNELVEANKERNEHLVNLQRNRDKLMKDRIQEERENRKTENATRNKLYQASADFKTSSWGLFNSDKPISYPEQIGTPSNFTIAGKSVVPSEIYVFDLKKDTRFSYGKNSRFIEHLGMNNNETIFIVIGKDSQLGYFKANSRKEFQSQKDKKLTKINGGQLNVDFFKRLLDEERVRA